MIINFSELENSNDKIFLEPRDIFMTLLNKDEKYGYPRDVQAEVWKQWYEKRDNKNLIIKMNTGSGKTLVGLMMLQSCLNEGKGPAVYVVPDNYLVKQVCSEAEKLGISVTEDVTNYHFKNKKSILVINIHKLVNGKSIFGLRDTGNIKIESIIIDDVHACLDVIEQQYTVNINSKNPAYDKIMDIFKQSQYLRQSQIFNNITDLKDPRCNKLIPFWLWQEHCEDIRKIIAKKGEEDVVAFHLPLVEDNWKTCDCVISASSIEITPKNIALSKISSFQEASRKIFMSATLADDSLFASMLGIVNKEELDIITPEKANDIGERLFLFPKHLNSKLSDESIKQKIASIGKLHNVSILVPSFERAEFWSDIKNEVDLQILNIHNMHDGIESIKTGEFKGVTIFLNKYDGIDLPDDCCRFLVIDGLPSMRSSYDIILQSMNPKDVRICREQIQKLEQGMGRGVRSNTDSCNIILMGEKLDNLLTNENGEMFFSNATRKQYNVSKKIWDQIMSTNENPEIDEIFSLTEYTLKVDNEIDSEDLKNNKHNWKKLIKNSLNDVEYEKDVKIDNVAVALRKAFDFSEIENYDEAFKIVEQLKKENITLDSNTKGILMQLMAEYKNFSNPIEAQKLLAAGKNLNKMIHKPIDRIGYKTLEPLLNQQGRNVLNNISKYDDMNKYMIRVQAIISDINFQSFEDDKKRIEYTNKFEMAINDIAEFIGFTSSRPEKEDDGGPDNLWSIGNMQYLIIECKNGVKTGAEFISKSDCGQMLNSIEWFKCKYVGGDFKYHPVIIHRASKFDKCASPSKDMKIMNEEKLELFKQNVLNFVTVLASNNSSDFNLEDINQLLEKFKLTSNQFVNNYTVRILS